MAVLALLCVAIVVGRVRFIRDLPDWDVATYALIGHELAHGERLYADAWDMKPPGIFASFAIAEWITRGSHAWSAYLLSVIAGVATTIAVYFVGATWSRSVGLWAAGFWTGVALQPALGAQLPNTEAFINAFLAIAIATALRRRVIIAGVALAIATLFKQVAIAPAIALAAWMCFAKFERPPRVLAMLAMIPLLWLVIFAYFALTGRGELFYQTNFVYSHHYGGKIHVNLLSALSPSHLFPHAMIELLPLVLTGVIGVIVSRYRWLFVALFIGTFLAIAMPGQFFRHYCQLWLVPLALASGAAMSRANLRVLGGIACVGLLILQSHWWLSSPGDRAAKLYPASTFLDVANTGQEIRDLLRDDQTMFVWCDEVQLYWLADKRSPATGLWKMHMTDGPMAVWLSQRTIEQLQQRPPDLIVTWTADPDQLAHPIGRWITENYSALPGNMKRYPLALHARNHSDLWTRARAALP